MPIAIQHGSEAPQLLDGLLWLVVMASLVYILGWLTVRSAGSWTRRRDRRLVHLGAGGTARHFPLWALGLVGAFSLPAAAQRRMPDAPSRHADAAPAPPWSATSGFPPPRPLVRIRALDGALTGRRDAALRRSSSGALRSPSRSPAPMRTEWEPVAESPSQSSSEVTGSGEASSDGRPVFARPPERAMPRTEHANDGRLSRRPQPAGHEDRQSRSTRGPAYVTPPEQGRSARDRARELHPAGKARTNGCPQALGTHVVVPGDTLWDIAATVLGTDDAARIARYWPTIHRANRALVGPDPSQIFPGTVLELPVECGAVDPAPRVGRRK